MQRYNKHCRKIDPYVKFYKKQIEYYIHTAYELLQNEIGLILQPLENNRKDSLLQYWEALHLV